MPDITFLRISLAIPSATVTTESRRARAVFPCWRSSARAAWMERSSSIRKSGVDGTVVVVTRYFGGILLGASGLVRAYSKAAAMAIEEAGIVTYREYTECTVTCDYSLYDKLLYDIGRRTIITDDTVFGSNIVLHLAVLSEEYGAFEKALYAMTNGKIVPEKKGTRLDA